MSPMEMIERYSADAIRYWAASTGLGKDTVISEEKIHAGTKLVNKLRNVSRFNQRFLKDYQPTNKPPELAVADRWILSRLYRLIERVTSLLERFDYAEAKSYIELFFWNDLTDNYLEMVKKRLYEDHLKSEGARYTLDRLLLTTVKLLAPFLPHVTEVIYQEFFAGREGFSSLHRSTWPEPDDNLQDDDAEATGEKIVQIATAVRRFKSTRKLSLAANLNDLYLITSNPNISALLEEAQFDIISVTRASRVTLTDEPAPDSEFILSEETFQVAVRR